jgi:hypothetical protein
MAESKPCTILTLDVVAIGTEEQLDDLFKQLNERGYLARSKKFKLEVEFYDEEDGLAARNQAKSLLGAHPAVLNTKSMTTIQTKQPPLSSQEEGEFDQASLFEDENGVDPTLGPVGFTKLAEVSPSQLILSTLRVDGPQDAMGISLSIDRPLGQVQRLLDELYRKEQITPAGGVWSLV